MGGGGARQNITVCCIGSERGGQGQTHGTHNYYFLHFYMVLHTSLLKRLTFI